MSKASKILLIIGGVLMIASGVYCLFTPIETYAVIGYVIGVMMIFYGACQFWHWFELRKTPFVDAWTLIGSILSIVLGCMVVSSGQIQFGVDVVLVYYAAVWLVIQGVLVIIGSTRVKKFHDFFTTQKLGAQWWLLLILGILMIAFGVLCCYKPLIMAGTLGILLGLGIIATGCSMIAIARLPIPDVEGDIQEIQDKMDEVTKKIEDGLEKAEAELEAEANAEADAEDK